MLTDQKVIEISNSIEVHAWLLIWSWAFAIPAGTLIWAHTKKHHDLQPYPHIHIVTSTVGLALAVAGFAVGVREFTTFSRGGVSAFRMAHAVIGTVATAGMILQVALLAFMKRTNVGDSSLPLRDSNAPLRQKIGHYLHRYLGWLWMGLGLIACETGTHMTSFVDPEYEHLGLDKENEKYAAAFIVALCATALAASLMALLYDRGARAADGRTTRDVAVPPHDEYEKTRDRSSGELVEETNLSLGRMFPKKVSPLPNTPPPEVFEIGNDLDEGLEMEDVDIEQ